MWVGRGRRWWWLIVVELCGCLVGIWQGMSRVDLPEW